MTCLLHNKMVKLVAGIAFLLAGSTMGTASAEDWKVHPAATCQPSSLDSKTNYFNSKGHLVNPTNSNLTVICPIVRDHHDTREGPKEVKNPVPRSTRFPTSVLPNGKSGTMG